MRLRLAAARKKNAFVGFDSVFESRIADADEFYERIAPKSLNEDQRRVHRQALAGMLWSKQYYYFDVEKWLREHKSHPLLESVRHDVRNTEWFHMLNADVISMPDKWEYPWYAAWDLAFHTISLALVDFDFAKEQLLLMLRSLYFHPSGQIPAYEWNFSDVNPPVHAFATLWLYKYEKQLGRADLRFLERSFQGLMLNFNWWVNRKDPAGRNVFAGGSWAWTTSASSIAARRSRRVARSSRRTGRRGWRSTARTCWRWPSSWPSTTRSTRSSPSSSSSISCGSPMRWIVAASITTRCGTSRTASSTICCGSRTARRCA